MEAYGPKGINDILNIIGVNSIMLGGLHIIYQNKPGLKIFIHCKTLIFHNKFNVFVLIKSIDYLYEKEN